MPISDLFPVSGFWWIDLAILLVLAMILLFMARSTAHDILLGAARAIASSLRVGNRALQVWSRQLERGARRATLTLVADHQARLASREIAQLRQEVARELKRFPDLSRAIQDDVRRIEQEYDNAPEMPEPPSAWGELIERVTTLEQGADPAVKETLVAVRGSIERVGRELAHAHGRHAQSANRTLSRLRPHWARIDQRLGRVGAELGRLESRLDRTDRSIRRFETVHHQRRTLSTRFRGWLALQFTAGAILVAVALLIALVNYHLIAVPMQEVMGYGNRIGPFPGAPLTATVLVLAQIAMAVVIADSAGFTRLITAIGRLTPSARRWLLAASGLALALLAASEASLAFLRDSIVLETGWLASELEGGISRGTPAFRWVPSMAQMFMGLVLPLALVALIPALESLLQTTRVGLLLVLSWLSGLLAIGCRLLARLVSSTGHLLAYVYDLLIVIPLSLERRFRRREPALGGGEE